MIISALYVTEFKSVWYILISSCEVQINKKGMRLWGTRDASAEHTQSCLTRWLFILYSVMLPFKTLKIQRGSSTVGWLIWILLVGVICDLWLTNVFWGCLIHLHLLPVVIVLHNINSNSSRCLVARSSPTKHTPVVWNDSHHSNFVSIRDHVNLCYHLLWLKFREPHSLPSLAVGRQTFSVLRNRKNL